jgi:DNA-binding NarL/FixJ family response regulator
MTIDVFLADDHAVMRDGLRMILESQPDIRVIGEAANGREAVRLVPILRPHALIIDITMADLNGIEAIHQIRARSPTVQIVVLSMHANHEYVTRALQAGALGYVLKESASADLIDAVRAAHAGSRYLSEKIAAEQATSQGPPALSPLQSLSKREREILQLIVEGKSSAQIASTLGLSRKTVETYRSRMMHKLGISDLPSLVKFAILHGLTPLE